MKTLLLLCFLACSWAEGEISPEPHVVLQSVVLGKKPDVETDSSDACGADYAAYNNMNMIMRRIMHGMYPQASRYKRDDGSYPDVETVDDKTLERILAALEEVKEDAEKNQEDAKERDEDSRKSRLDQICRRAGKWHRKIEECQAKRRKGEMESYKKLLRDNFEDFLSENKDLEKRLRQMIYRKKDWKEEMELRRLKESLSESWPRMSDDKMSDDLYAPMSYHHQPSHQRAYPSGYMS